VWHGSDVHPHSELGQSRRFRDALKESDCPPPDNGYRMHTSLLQKSAGTDSLVGIGLAEGDAMSMEVGLGRFGDRRLEKGGRHCMRRSFDGLVHAFGALPGTERRRFGSRVFYVMKG
jgi:hypothetical protein